MLILQWITRSCDQCTLVVLYYLYGLLLHIVNCEKSKHDSANSLMQLFIYLCRKKNCLQSVVHFTLMPEFSKSLVGLDPESFSIRENDSCCCPNLAFLVTLLNKNLLMLVFWLNIYNNVMGSLVQYHEMWSSEYV